MIARRLLPAFLLLTFSLFLAACVPETDLERIGGTSSNDDSELTPIPENDLPDVDDLELRVLSIDTHRTGGRVAVEIAIGGAGSGDDVRLADTAQVEWSDGELSDALPLPGANIIIEAGRSDSDGELEPVRVHLSNVTRHLGVDEDAEVTSDEIISEFGEFPVIEIEEGRRPPGWKLEYQAAGQRWVAKATLIDEQGRHRIGESEDLIFTEEFAPISAVLRFGTEIEDLETALPMTAHIEVRQAIPEMTVDL
jgi:hypothetical protein